MRRDSVNRDIQVDPNGIIHGDSDGSSLQDSKAKLSPFQKHLCQPIKLKSRQEQSRTITPTRVNCNGNDLRTGDAVPSQRASEIAKMKCGRNRFLCVQKHEH